MELGVACCRINSFLKITSPFLYISFYPSTSSTHVQSCHFVKVQWLVTIWVMSHLLNFVNKLCGTFGSKVMSSLLKKIIFFSNSPSINLMIKFWTNISGNTCEKYRWDFHPHQHIGKYVRKPHEPQISVYRGHPYKKSLYMINWQYRLKPF